jgi:hypothetical protein
MGSTPPSWPCHALDIVADLHGLRRDARCHGVTTCIRLPCPWPRVQSLTRTLSQLTTASAVASLRPSRGVCRPSTLAEAGSDHCRVCLTRLRGAFRLLRPLDASFRLQPRRPCFMSATPLGFRLQRFSPPGSRSPSPVRCPSCCFPKRRALARLLGVNREREPRPAGRSFKGLEHPRDPCCAGSVLSETRQPILS